MLNKAELIQSKDSLPRPLDCGPILLGDALCIRPRRLGQALDAPGSPKLNEKRSHKHSCLPVEFVKLERPDQENAAVR